jgi:putative FmdB family regulatory protein
MPIFEYLCLNCGKVTEVLIAVPEDKPQCQSCGGGKLKKMISAHSSLSGASTTSLPGAGDTACCGTSPMQAGCAGPGSCCGKQVE